MDAAADMQLITDATVEAGRMALDYFQRAHRSWQKEGGSPVTEADVAVDTFLRETLTAARPDYGWLSEETADTSDRLEKPAVFVVDPIDGTRGFVAGDKRWCVSVAVIRDGRPVAGVVNVPALEKIYTATRGGGAHLGGERLAVTATARLTDARLAGPRSWIAGSSLAEQVGKEHSYLPSLAYRLALVADATLDCAFARPRAHDWDIAAADLLVHEAGGRLTTLDGRPPRYNRASLLHGVLAASGPGLHDTFLDTVRRIASAREAAHS